MLTVVVEEEMLQNLLFSNKKLQNIFSKKSAGQKIGRKAPEEAKFGFVCLSLFMLHFSSFHSRSEKEKENIIFHVCLS